MDGIRQVLLTGWHLMRWVKLGAGILIAVQAVLLHDPVFWIFAGFFLFLAFSNTGCCGMGRCPVPSGNKTAAGKSEDGSGIQ